MGESGGGARPSRAEGSGPGRGRRWAVAAGLSAGAAGAHSAAGRGALCGGGRGVLRQRLLRGGGAGEQWAPSPRPSEGPWRKGRGGGRRGAWGAP